MTSARRDPQPNELPLAQILFRQGFGTRREVAALLAEGAVCIDGRVAFDGDQRWPLACMALEVRGVAWPVHATALVMLHKPAGTECSLKPGAWPSVLTLLPPPLRVRGVQPVGRLDQDTTGLLLLTDDGQLLHRLTSPRHHVAKVYQATTARPVTEEQVQALRQGVLLRDDPQPVAAAAARALGMHRLELVLTEGRYHQVKRMVAAVGNHVEDLHRSAFGPLELPADLAPGQWRWLDADEAAALRAATGRAGSGDTAAPSPVRMGTVPTVADTDMA